MLLMEEMVGIRQGLGLTCHTLLISYMLPTLSNSTSLPFNSLTSNTTTTPPSLTS